MGSRPRVHRLTPQELLAQGQQHSVPVLGQMEALLLADLHAVLSGSLLGKALHYLRPQWHKLKLGHRGGQLPGYCPAHQSRAIMVSVGRLPRYFKRPI